MLASLLNPEFEIERSTGCNEAACVLGSDIADFIIQLDRSSERAVPIFYVEELGTSMNVISSPRDNRV